MVCVHSTCPTAHHFTGRRRESVFNQWTRLPKQVLEKRSQNLNCEILPFLGKIPPHARHDLSPNTGGLTHHLYLSHIFFFSKNTPEVVQSSVVTGEPAHHHPARHNVAHTHTDCSAPPPHVCPLDPLCLVPGLSCLESRCLPPTLPDLLLFAPRPPFQRTQSTLSQHTHPTPYPLCTAKQVPCR